MNLRWVACHGRKAFIRESLTAVGGILYQGRVRHRRVPPDDAIFPTASHGSFYVADTGANPVYAITASGLVSNTSLHADVGDAFNSVNTSTGVVTPILAGVSPHGMDFVV